MLEIKKYYATLEKHPNPKAPDITVFDKVEIELKPAAMVSPAASSSPASGRAR